MTVHTLHHSTTAWVCDPIRSKYYCKLKLRTTLALIKGNWKLQKNTDTYKVSFYRFSYPPLID